MKLLKLITHISINPRFDTLNFFLLTLVINNKISRNAYRVIGHHKRQIIRYIFSMRECHHEVGLNIIQSFKKRKYDLSHTTNGQPL